MLRIQEYSNICLKWVTLKNKMSNFCKSFCCGQQEYEILVDISRLLVLSFPYSTEKDLNAESHRKFFCKVLVKKHCKQFIMVYFQF